MKELIEKKLEEYGKKILTKSEISMDDVNFLVFWMNRLEMKEKAETAKANEEILRAQQEEHNKAWKESMTSMLENVWGGK